MNLLRSISILSLSIGGICLLIISADLLMGHAQKMWIMNIVWPVTALYAGPLALIAYYTIGRKSMKKINSKHQDNVQGTNAKKTILAKRYIRHTALRQWLHFRRYHCRVWIIGFSFHIVWKQRIWELVS